MSSHERKLTEKGVIQAQQIEAQKECLLRVWAAAADQHTPSPEPGPSLIPLDSSEPSSDVNTDDDNPFCGLCDDGIFPSSAPSLDSPSDSSNISLDIDDYLQRDIESTLEATFLSIRSDIHRDPQSPGYDLSIPPASHNEAMLHPDVEKWKEVQKKEFRMLKEMKVYVEEDLPVGRKAIGSRWVFEFKVEEGAMPIAKGRFVAQGFSQIPFVNYNSTFAPVAKSVNVCFIAVYSAIHGWFLKCFDAT